ncbi:hypothetical protein [Kitasatospora phosalacinea]|uniref:hypothetical protein n=1 Tax=Kitasatospora phosalacinea TaxID=2065 RepID=UPI0005265961|nr:hypothetical protein [Kitasatospora phosalacinea]
MALRQAVADAPVTRRPRRTARPVRAGSTEPERAVRICALEPGEPGGRLTGAFGVFADLPPDLAGEGLPARAAAEIAADRGVGFTRGPTRSPATGLLAGERSSEYAENFPGRRY